MPRFDCTTAAGVQHAIAQTHRSESTMGLLDLPEAMLNEALSQLGIKYLRRFGFASKYALARARARIAQLPDKNWVLGLGDPRSQATVYYRREEQTGAAWLKRYEDSIVLWDASGGARCFPRTAAAARDKWYCQACVKHIPRGSYMSCTSTMPCCGAVVCVSCSFERSFYAIPRTPPRANCVLCGANQTRRTPMALEELFPVERVLNAKEDQYLREQLHPLATKGSASAQYMLGTRYNFGRAQNIETALLWYERAARQGHAGAQFFAARIFSGCPSHAAPGPANHPREAEYLAMCVAQHPDRRFEAIADLGQMYFYGQIPTPDAETRYKEAVRLLKLDIQLADERHKDSHLLLGKCYLQGLGVPADRDEAERIWQYAVTEHGDREALQELEDNGMEVPEDCLDY